MVGVAEHDVVVAGRAQQVAHEDDELVGERVRCQHWDEAAGLALQVGRPVGEVLEHGSDAVGGRDAVLTGAVEAGRPERGETGRDSPDLDLDGLTAGTAPGRRTPADHGPAGSMIDGRSLIDERR